MSFAAEAKQHLATYKKASFPGMADGVWSGNKEPYPHILPKAEERRNVFGPFAAEFWNYADGAGIKLHADFHHLTSSQAMAFNLFFPALTVRQGNPAATLVEALSGRAGAVERWAFEAVPDAKEGTNFDLMLDLQGGKKVFVEVKFTETSFGKAADDEAHRRKLERTYRPGLKGIVKPDFLQEAPFFAHYQLFRNIWHARAGGHSVALVVPKGNDVAIAHARTVLEQALEAGVDWVRLVNLESIVDRLDAVAAGTDYADHYGEFRRKYLVPGGWR